MEMLAQLRETLAEFERRGVNVTCIVQGTAAETERFCGRHRLSGVCIGDPHRDSYRSMGLERISWWRILLPTAAFWRRRKEASAAGCSVSLSGTLQKHTDILQLPGAALIDQRGKIVWVHRGTHPGDLPSASELLAMIDQRAPGRQPPPADQPTVEGSA